MTRTRGLIEEARISDEIVGQATVTAGPRTADSEWLTRTPSQTDSDDAETVSWETDRHKAWPWWPDVIVKHGPGNSLLRMPRCNSPLALPSPPHLPGKEGRDVRARAVGSGRVTSPSSGSP